MYIYIYILYRYIYTHTYTHFLSLSLTHIYTLLSVKQDSQICVQFTITASHFKK